MLDNIAGISTVEEVDPRLSKAQAEKEYSKGSDKIHMAEYGRIECHRPEGREVYNNMVKTYGKLYKTCCFFKLRLNSTDIQEETRQKLKGVYKKMLNRRIKPLTFA